MGAALAGESSIAAALREAKEELGLVLDPSNGVLLNRSTRHVDDGHYDFVDAWVFEHDCPLEDVHIQESETCDIMWATADKIRKMMVKGEFVSEWYPYFDEMVKKWG